MNFNKVIIGGRLTRDPQVKHLPSQTVVAEFGVACNRKFKTSDGADKEEVTFVDMTAFGRTAEVISQYLTKGSQALFEGRLKFDTWDDKQGGGKRSKLTVVVEHFQFVGGRDPGDAAPEAEERPARPVNHRGPMEQRQHAGAAANFVKAMGGGKPRTSAVAEPPFGDESQFKDEDIPFAWQGRQGSAI